MDLCVCVCERVCIQKYIYIYTEMERERTQERERGGEVIYVSLSVLLCSCMYAFKYHSQCIHIVKSILMRYSARDNMLHKSCQSTWVAVSIQF